MDGHERQHNAFIASLFVVGMVFGMIGVFSYTISRSAMQHTSTEASTQFTLQSSSLSTLSSYEDAGNATFFSLMSRSKDQGMYQLKDSSTQTVIDFLSRKPTFSLFAAGQPQQVVPDAFSNLRLRKSATDRQLDAEDSQEFDLQNVDTQSKHFYFEQTRCDGVPVFGAYLNVHVSKTADIYALSGALIEGEPSCTQTLSESQAQAKARETFVKSFGGQAITLRDSKAYIYSSRMFHEGGSKNYLTEYVTVCSSSYCHAYFVDRADGTIRDDLPITTDAKNRYVYSGSAQRTEGQPPVSNQDVNKAYDIMGNVWDHYSNVHQRDSFDGRGGRIQVNIKNCSQIDASWDGQQISSCNAIADTDVLAHEFQHGVTQYTAGLVYRSESGALNEGLSDSFGAAIDSDDWLMGEEGIRAIRSLQDPPQFKHPDSMVSSNFYCGGSDNGGVHINSGVMNKAYYLMSDGGTFNGCTMNGLGRERAIKILYKAITTYMNGKASGIYKDMYDAINLACNDIHSAGSAECANVKASLEATYMDKPSRCKGGSASGTTCAGGNPPPPPSGTPTPSGEPQPTPSDTPTGVPSESPSPEPTTSGPTPTSVPESTKEAPLLSILSSPKFISGDIKITKTGTTTRVYATLQPAAIQSLSAIREAAQGVDPILEVKGRLIGKDTIETGFFVQRGDLILNEFTTDRDVSDYDSYQVYFAKSDQYDELPVLVGDLSTGTGSEAPQQDAIVLDLTLRLQGIDKKPPSTQAQLVRVGLSGGTLEGITYKKAVFTPNEQGLWTGRVIFNGAGDLDNGAVRIKASKHIQKKYCENTPSEKNPGLYICESEEISLKKGINNLDFSGVVQMAGDINQDGRVNSADIAKIRNSIGSTAADDLMFGDVNSDGVINSIDDALSIYTLSNKSQQS